MNCRRPARPSTCRTRSIRTTPDRAQHQAIGTINVAPGYTQVVGSKTLFTANGFVRQDHLNVLAQRRSVRGSAGERVAGPDADQPRREGRRVLHHGQPQREAGRQHQRHEAERELHHRLHRSVVQRAVEPRFQPGPRALRSDARRIAARLCAVGHHQAAGGLRPGRHQSGNASFKLGLRLDHYDGLSQATLLQPRLGVSYAVPQSNTVVRASYGRTLETPYNENLLLSSASGSTGCSATGRSCSRASAISGGRDSARGEQVGRPRLRLFQQAHRQRLRLRRPLQHAESSSLCRGITRRLTGSRAASTWSSIVASAPSS